MKVRKKPTDWLCSDCRCYNSETDNRCQICHKKRWRVDAKEIRNEHH